MILPLEKDIRLIDFRINRSIFDDNDDITYIPYSHFFYVLLLVSSSYSHIDKYPCSRFQENN
jgi:hypothetical protein